MRITKATPYLCFPGSRKNWLFVKIETDEGITGWGECYTHLDRDRNIFTIVEELSRYLVDRDPFKIKSLTYFAYVDFAKKRGSIDFFAAVSGIEMALWDIVGKALNTPVYKLLGGAMHDKLRLYANGWFYKSASSEEVAEQAQKMVERGFTGLKIDPLPNAWNMFLSPEEEQYAIDRIKAIREAVGPKVDLMMDCHRRLSAYDALHLAERIEEYNLYWYEEPVSSKNLPLLAETKNKVKMRVVTGEELYTKAEFRQCFESHCTDTINPDLCNCGGILELKEIAAMAEIYYVSVAPHNCNSSFLATAAMAHACAGMPNFLIAEYFVNLEQGRDLVSTPLKIENGYLILPKGPGLGVEIDEKAIKEHPYLPTAQRKMHEIV